MASETPASRSWAAPLIIVAVVGALILAVLWTASRQDDEQSGPGSSQGEAQGAGSESGSGSTDTASDAGASGDSAADGADGADADPTEVAVPDLSPMERRIDGDQLAEGPVDAPVTLIIYTDFQCSFCARWHQETLPVLRERVDAGQLRIEFRDLAVFGEDSERAARAAYAASLQGRYADYADALFEGGTTRKGDLSTDALVSLADELGMDGARFEKDMTSTDTAQAVGENMEEGAMLGVTSTPSFIIGGRPLVGAQPTEVFVGAVDEALERAQDKG